MTDLDRYLVCIRSDVKRDYARRYVAWKRTGVGEPPLRGMLSYMAAQAVRMEIDRLLVNSPPTFTVAEVFGWICDQQHVGNPDYLSDKCFQSLYDLAGLTTQKLNALFALT